MKWKIAILVLAATGSALAVPASVTPSDLVGTWRCGPTVMQRPEVTVTTSDETTNASDGTYTSRGTIVTTLPDKHVTTVLVRSSGTWELKGDIVRTHVQHGEFLSASDPSITKEEGQRLQDDQLRKKSVFEDRILEFTGTRSRSIPINSMYKSAVVETGCERI
ncbi:MAG: hypothetical protein ABI411_05145 [Tahibacter sp.]